MGGETFFSRQSLHLANHAAPDSTFYTFSTFYFRTQLRTLRKTLFSCSPYTYSLIPTKMKDIVRLTSDTISLDEIAKSVHDPKAGAISTFSGTTRDNFEGKLFSSCHSFMPECALELYSACCRLLRFTHFTYAYFYAHSIAC